MIRAKIFNEDTVIFDLHAEQVFLNIGKISRIKEGIFIKHLSNKPLDALKEHIIDVTQTNVYLDFSNLKSVQNNLKSIFFSILKTILENHKNFFIANINETIKKQLKLEEILNELGINNDKISESDEILTLSQNQIVENYAEFKKNLFESKLVELLIKNTPDYNETHSSSPVRLPRYINIKGLIHEKTFFYYCLYLLGINLSQGFFKDNSNKVIFCQTLNGAFIGSFLSELLNIDIIFLDHIGPINKLYGPSLSNRIEPGREYVVVSDVVCLGTELQVAKNIIIYRGGVYAGNINIIRIKTLKESLYKNEVSLFRIDSENNPVQYKIEIDI